jgi:ribosomal protein S18 acetylase RimI-like enzyme
LIWEAAPMDIVVLRTGDEDRVVAAQHLFDAPADGQATRRFLATEGHHLLVAYIDGVAAGFVSGVEMTHPDKGTEMLVYELAVDERYRRRGVARSLLEELKSIASGRGCYGMWVLTDDSNEAALATYSSTGAVREGEQVMFAWHL